MFRAISEAEGHFVAGFIEALSGYLHGFLCAESSFGLDRSHTGLTVHMRRDERPLLEMLAARSASVTSGPAGVRHDSAVRPPGTSTASMTSCRLAAWLDPELMRGRKRDRTGRVVARGRPSAAEAPCGGSSGASGSYGAARDRLPRSARVSTRPRSARWPRGRGRVTRRRSCAAGRTLSPAGSAARVTRRPGNQDGRPGTPSCGGSDPGMRRCGRPDSRIGAHERRPTASAALPGARRRRQPSASGCSRRSGMA